jgi:hypothetical protein
MQQTNRRMTLKVRDLVTGKTMTVEEWKQHKARIAEQVRKDMATDQTRAYGPWQQTATHGGRA